MGGKERVKNEARKLKETKKEEHKSPPRRTQK
jgi:hypothetical protein